MAVFVHLNSKNLHALSDREIVEKIHDLAKQTIGFDNEAVLTSELNQQITNFSFQIISLPGDGEIIQEKIARDMIKNFNGAPQNFSINKIQLNNYITQITTRFPSNIIPAGQSIGIRFHLGKDAGGKYNVVAVPVCGPDRDPQTKKRAHEFDQEKTFFTNNTVPFFALNIADGSVITNAGNAKTLIADKDTMVVNPNPTSKAATQIVYFSLLELKKFLQLTTGNTITVHFSRIAANDCLSIVLEDESILVYFDKGDLIPPPPSDTSKPVDDTSF